MEEINLDIDNIRKNDIMRNKIMDEVKAVTSYYTADRVVKAFDIEDHYCILRNLVILAYNNCNEFQVININKVILKTLKIVMSNDKEINNPIITQEMISWVFEIPTDNKDDQEDVYYNSKEHHNKILWLTSLMETDTYKNEYHALSVWSEQIDNNIDNDNGEQVLDSNYDDKTPYDDDKFVFKNKLIANQIKYNRSKINKIVLIVVLIILFCIGWYLLSVIFKPINYSFVMTSKNIIPALGDYTTSKSIWYKLIKYFVVKIIPAVKTEIIITDVTIVLALFANTVWFTCINIIARRLVNFMKVQHFKRKHSKNCDNDSHS